VAHAPGGFLKKSTRSAPFSPRAPLLRSGEPIPKMDEAIRNDPDFRRRYRLVMERESPLQLDAAGVVPPVGLRAD